jgi:biopolymer transport protein ExbD
VRLIPARARRRPPIALNMAAMIDATFLLLCYFILTTGAARPEDRLSPALGGAKGGGAQDLTPQIVEVKRIDGRDAFVIGTRQLFDRSALTEALRTLPKEQGLFVRVHAGPTVAAAATAMQAGSDAGFKQVTYVPAEDGAP